MLEKAFKRSQDQYMTTLHRYVTTHQDSKALMLMLDDYEIQSANPVIYEELFNSIRDWGGGRALLCVGRLIINLHIQQRKYARALMYAEQCHLVVQEFVLADPNNVLLLASMAMDSKQYELAYWLVTDAYERYGDALDYHACELLDIELLQDYLVIP